MAAKVPQAATSQAAVTKSENTTKAEKDGHPIAGVRLFCRPVPKNNGASTLR